MMRTLPTLLSSLLLFLAPDLALDLTRIKKEQDAAFGE